MVIEAWCKDKPSARHFCTMPCKALSKLPLKLARARSTKSLKETTSASCSSGTYCSLLIRAKTASRWSTKSAACSIALAAQPFNTSNKSPKSILTIGMLKLICIPSGLYSLPNSLTRKLSKVGIKGFWCKDWVKEALSSNSRISSAAIIEALKPAYGLKAEVLLPMM